MRLLLILIAGIMPSLVFSQIRFEPGYYIDNNGQKIAGEIRNVDWKNNPSSILFRTSATAEPVTLTLAEVQEFLAGDRVNYIRKTIKLDTSGIDPRRFSNQIEPAFIDTTVFLKVLLRGPASLYKFEKGGFVRFFYHKAGDQPQPLVYKEYQTVDESYRSANTLYRGQLQDSLLCATITKDKYDKTGYSEKDLTRAFLRYNTCVDPSSGTVFSAYKDQRVFNFTVRAGIGRNAIHLKEAFLSSVETTLDGIAPRVSLELEYLLPFNKSKWGVVLDPGFHTFKKTETLPNWYDREVSVKYSALEIPLGIRHYFFLTKELKLYLTGFVAYQFVFSKEVEYKTYTKLELDPNFNFVGSAGLKFGDKYSAEIRHSFNSDLLRNYVTWRGKYQHTALTFGYCLWSK